ncbi:MAG: methyltransferase domain-containing protein [Dehalococcoidia bacterium]|nr:methyltransferase domain-containing protein [Dehalococcoidia bacterium]
MRESDRRTSAPVNRGNGGAPPGRAAAQASRRLTAGRTLGPVSDLERHLPSEWWRDIFNAVYLKTDGDLVENDENTRREVDLLISATGIGPEDRVLDLCCGQGRHSLELARRGYRHVTGIDRSRYLVRLARRRAPREGLAVSFHEGDARKFQVRESSFDLVALMGNSFGYFDREEDDAAVLEQVKRALRSGGTLFMDVADGDWMRENYERRSWEWIDQDHFVCRERSLSADGTRLISREVVVDAEKGVLADQFYAERLYSPQALADLFQRAGFLDLRFHQEPEIVSTRNQDLGMMSRRNFLTVKAPHKLATARRRGAAIPDVAVLLGDPRRPDSVKLEGQFNAEDFVTIEKLKEALAELTEYRFSYIDNHAALIQELRQRPPAFALNLCDEGYNNDAFKELHIPAYLEMLGVPYSGAGPSALGLCYDKSLVRAIAEPLDVAVPLETMVDPDDLAGTIPSIFPALIKPALGDSSLGITQHAVVHTAEEAVAYLAYLRHALPGRAALIQEFLTGPEYSVGVIGNPGFGYTVLPLLEVDYGDLPPELPRILSYESKWQPDSPYWTHIKYREADTDEETRRRLTDHSTRLFERLGCRDYARFDFRADAEGNVKLLEVNPNPGWCWDGKLNLMATFGGIRYSELLRMIIEAAQSRVLTTGQQPAELSVPVGAGR